MTMFQAFAGIIWFSAAAFYAAHLGDTLTFHMILAIGHMILGGGIALAGLART